MTQIDERKVEEAKLVITAAERTVAPPEFWEAVSTILAALEARERELDASAERWLREIGKREKVEAKLQAAQTRIGKLVRAAKAVQREWGTNNLTKAEKRLAALSTPTNEG